MRVDARSTTEWEQRYGSFQMFHADQSLGKHRWPLVRMQAGSHVEVVLLSARFFALTTHWNKCTVPCCGENCKLCEVLPARGLFYVAVGCQSVVSILELGAQSASHFEQHAKLFHGGMIPGLVFELTRRGAKQPVRSQVIRVKEGCREVEDLELATRVMALYKFPCPNPEEGLVDYSDRLARIARVRCDRAFDLLSAEHSRRV